MNLERLREAERDYIFRYPQGYDDPEMISILKKHKMQKMHDLARSSFAPDRFNNPEAIVASLAKLVGASSLISVFDKPKFRDLANALTTAERGELAAGLQDLLYGDEAAKASGFEQMATVLRRYKMASWSMLTVAPGYFDTYNELCLKPNTVKAIIDYYELPGLSYHSQPDYAFYKAYRDTLLAMKEQVPAFQDVELIAFSGMLWSCLPKR